MHWEPVLAPSDGEDAPSGLPPFAEARPRPAAAFAKELPLLVLVALLAAFLVRTFVFQAFYIPSPSMGCAGPACPVHTLEVDDKIVVSKLSYRLHEPRRGDIVDFECPPAADCVTKPRSTNAVARALRAVGERLGVVPPSTDDYIKRIVALEGEMVEGRQGHVYVNGFLLHEPYLPEAVVTSDFGPVIVPPNQYWVMGDNRQNSGDSRGFGPITEESIVGRTVMRLLPITRTAFL